MNELHAHATRGLTLYAVLLTSSGQAWDGSAFVSIDGDDWGLYALGMAEAAAGIYLATMPAVAAGVYSYVVYERAGGSPATSDAQRGAGWLAWDGSAEIVPLVPQEIADALKQAPAAGTPATGSVYDLLGDAAIDPQAVRDAMKLAPTAGDPAAGSVDAHLDAVALEATAQAVLAATARNGAGSVAWTYTLASDVDATPIPQARIEIWNAANNVLITQAYTDNNGQALFYLDPGTYSLRRSKAGWSFALDTETVEEPAP